MAVKQQGRRRNEYLIFTPTTAILATATISPAQLTTVSYFPSLSSLIFPYSLPPFLFFFLLLVPHHPFWETIKLNLTSDITKRMAGLCVFSFPKEKPHVPAYHHSRSPPCTLSCLFHATTSKMPASGAEPKQAERARKVLQ